MRNREAMLTITIIDNDIFFKDSLHLLLEHHFKNKDIKIRFTGPDHKFPQHSDLLFLSTSYATNNLILLPFFCRSFMGMHFQIIEQENNHEKEGVIHSCIKEWPIISRKDAVSIVIDKINQSLDLYNEKTRMYSERNYMQCHICSKYKLAPQENEVIRLIAKEKTLTVISNILKRSVKTVHSQKKSAMKKLGVGSNFELYTLLRKNSQLLQ